MKFHRILWQFYGNLETHDDRHVERGDIITERSVAHFGDKVPRPSLLKLDRKVIEAFNIHAFMPLPADTNHLENIIAHLIET